MHADNVKCTVVAIEINGNTDNTAQVMCSDLISSIIKMHCSTTETHISHVISAGVSTCWDYLKRKRKKYQ